MKARVLSGQSLFDIAIARCGDTSAAYAIARLNGLSVTDPLAEGQALDIPPPRNADVAGYFSGRGIEPATALTDRVYSILELEGLDYWIVGVDFTVS